MARIPVYTSEASIKTGQTGAELDSSAAQAVPRAMLGLAGGLGRFAEGADSAAAHAMTIEARKEEADNLRQVSRLTSQLHRNLSNWEANDTNRGSESYAADFQAFSDQQLQDFSAQIPNQKARDLFLQHNRTLVDHRYDQALKYNEDLKLSNAHVDLQGSIAEIAMTHNQDVGSMGSPENAAQIALQNTQLQLDYVTRVFGKSAPRAAAAMRSEIVSGVALGVADKNPAFARDSVEGSKDLTEQHRSVLLNHIKTIEERGLGIAQDSLRTQLGIEKRFAIDNDKDMAAVPAARFSVFGANAQREFAQYETERKLFNETMGQWRAIRGWNYNEAAKEVSAIAKTGNGNDPLIASALAGRLDGLKSVQEKQPGLFLDHYNDEVKAASRSTGEATKETRGAYFARYYETKLKYQGFAPENTPEDEAKLYLGHAVGEWQLVNPDDAKSRVGLINNSPPQGKDAALTEFLQSYPNSLHRSIAYQDLVRNGLPEMTQLAFLSQDKAIRQQIYGYISNPKLLAEIAPTEEKKAEFYDALNNHDAWVDFRHATIGDLAQRVPDIAGFHSGIINYATALASLEKLKPKDAVDLAIKRTLLDYGDFTDPINGQKLFLPKREYDWTDKVPVGQETSAKTIRTSDEIRDYGRRLQTSLSPKNFPLKELSLIDPTTKLPRFPTLPPPAGPNDVNYWQRVYDIVTSTGSFRTDPHGQSVTFYMVGDNGIPFQATNNDGEAFRIRLKDLPQFRHMESVPVHGSRLSYDLEVTREVNDSFEKTYKLLEKKPYTFRDFTDAVEKHGPYGLFDPFTPRETLRTNWPTRAAFWKFQRAGLQDIAPQLEEIKPQLPPSKRKP